ncbi:6-carboxytetrahydropterin synthase [Granulicella paludicola]|uniref:6-carboxytetrahydropterin synthase n=1 Tax=Granulicella paludicola TaxID=474951 RepID=UPI0021DF6D01|nr:6-carboxytetrahydropterin synthase [Granulicella paludicola]
MSTPVVHFSRRYHFSASHRLHVDALSPDQNRDTFGKCNNPFGHGHNYVVQVTLSGPVDAATGMVTNLADLDSFAQRKMLDLFDHANLNTLDLFRDQVSTTENLCVEVWRMFCEYPHAILRRVHIEETGNNSFDYYGDGAPISHLD